MKKARKLDLELQYILLLHATEVQSLIIPHSGCEEASIKDTIVQGLVSESQNSNLILTMFVAYLCFCSSAVQKVSPPHGRCTWYAKEKGRDHIAEAVSQELLKSFEKEDRVFLSCLSS